MADNRCKLCDILGNIPRDVAPYAEKLYSMMPADEKADEALMKKRLEVCSSCDKKQDSTCLKCGCYIQVRVLSVNSRCPTKKW
jgi:hypothetical protein